PPKQAQLHLQQYQQQSLSTSYPQETNFQLHQMRTKRLKQQRTTEMDSGPGGQASIVGGAIEFVKELEQHLLSLRAQKRFQASVSVSSRADDNDKCSAPALHDGFFTSSQYMGYSQSQEEDATAVAVEATLVQGHVNLKVAAQRLVGQLVAAMEELWLSILHLSITALEPPSIFYSINLNVRSSAAPCFINRS
ncbi:hypothetical protein GW17_00035824, partial [Ensete ventricosum]